MKDFQKQMLFGIWAGSASGFIVLLAQSFLEVYGQKNNMAYAFALIGGINLLIILIVATYNTGR